jgi:hypothetical protein
LQPTSQTPRQQTPYEREQSTKRRGEISELAFALAAARHGFGIARPYGDSERYDLILDSAHLANAFPPRPRLIRVQVKATTQLQSGLYRVNAHRRIHGKAVPYTLDEIDFFAAYVIPADTFYILPLAATHSQPDILLSPHRQNSKYSLYKEAWHLLMPRPLAACKNRLPL